MRIEKISSNKLKISVSMVDLTRWNIPVEALAPNSPRLREFLIGLMKQAKLEVGFDALGRNVMIETVLQPNGYTFFVTKMGSDTVDFLKTLLQQRIQASQHHTKGATPEPKKIFALYQFASITDFLSYLDSVSTRKDYNGLILYKGDTGFYLKIPLDSPVHLKMSVCALDFSDPVDSQHMRAHIEEQGKIFCHGENFETLKQLYD